MKNYLIYDSNTEQNYLYSAETPTAAVMKHTKDLERERYPSTYEVYEVTARHKIKYDLTPTITEV